MKYFLEVTTLTNWNGFNQNKAYCPLIKNTEVSAKNTIVLNLNNRKIQTIAREASYSTTLII